LLVFNEKKAIDSQLLQTAACDALAAAANLFKLAQSCSPALQTRIPDQ
jgi:hypothetical protein